MENVPIEEAREQVRKVSTRIGMLHISFARVLVDEFGEEKGRELVLKAIKDYGQRIGSEVKGRVLSAGLDTDPENYQEDLPLYGMHHGLEVVEVDGEKRIRAYGCEMGRFWDEKDENKLGGLYCYVDPAKYMAFNPDYKLVHTRAIPNGDEYCELVVRPTTKKEREDFKARDKDWSYLDETLNNK